MITMALAYIMIYASALYKMTYLAHIDVAAIQLCRHN